MKLKILTDNNTIIDSYFVGEPAVCYLLQEDGKKILFDLGYSDVFIQNALKMDESLEDIDFIAFSHGHNDHTGGLKALTSFYKNSSKKPTIIAHPDTFNHKAYEDEDIGSFLSLEDVKETYSTTFTCKPFWISEKLVFLGEIPRLNDFESCESIGKCEEQGEMVDDFVKDDTALAYKSEKGLVIITGCSHAGICNIIEYAKKVCEDERIVDVIGGFHLLEPSKKQSDKTVEYFKNAKIILIHPCHCTSLKEKIKLSQVTNIEEVGVGQVFDF